MLLQQDCCSLSDVDTFSGATISGFAGFPMVLGVTEAPKMAFSHYLEFVVPNYNLLLTQVYIANVLRHKSTDL